MRTFTLDTNCLIAIEKCEPEAAEVRALADAHAAGKANVAVVAMSASEKQQDGVYIKNFEEFRERLVGLDLAHLDILKPMAYWNIGFWDWCLWSGPDMQSLEKQIHTILFPNVEFSWQDYCRANASIQQHHHPLASIASGAIANATFRPSGATFMASGMTS